MVTVRVTEEFQDWLDNLRDRRAQVRIAARVRALELGSLGDWKSLGRGLSELRVHFGPGYRLYFGRRSNVLIVILADGDKSSQASDIRRARQLLEDLDPEELEQDDDED